MKKISLILLLTLSGCFGSGPAPVRYTLNTQKAVPQEVHPSRHYATVRVLPPKTEAGLDSDRILVEQPDGQLEVVQNAVWAERLGSMVQSLFIRSLQQSGAYHSVIDGEDTGTAALTLRTTIERFTLVYETGHHAHVEVSLHVELLNRAGQVVRDKDLSATVSVQSVRMHTIIPAFEQAFSECIGQWLER